MSIKLYDYENKKVASTTQEDKSSSGITMFSYDEAPVVEAPLPITPVLPQVKPTFKTFKDLSLKQKVTYGLEKAYSNIYQGLQENVAGSIEGVTALKDVTKGAISSESTSAKELADDTETDKTLKSIASIYSSGAASTKQDLTDVKSKLGLNPESEFSDSLLNGVGQVMGFMAGGLALKGASTLLKLGKYTGTILNAGNSFLESGMEANDTYKELKKQGKTDQEAFEGYRHSLATNVALIGITNKLGGVFEEKNFQGIKRIAKAVYSGLMEGGQEFFQTIEGNFTQGKPILEGAKESFLIGSILGVPTALVFDQPSKDGTVTEPSKEKLQEIIDSSTATDDKKEIAQKILEGTVTEQEKETYFTDAITNPEFGVALDEKGVEALKQDISELIDTGHTVIDISNGLYEQGLKQSIVEDIVADVLSNKNLETIKNTIKEEVKPFIEASKAEIEAKKVQDQIKSDEKIAELPRAKRMAFEEVSMILGAAEAGKRVFIPEKNSSDLQVKGVPSTFPAWIPENMRSRKVFDQVTPFWEKQEVPPKKSPRVLALYNLLQKHSVEMEKQYQETIDRNMEIATKDDGHAFKESKNNEKASTQEMGVVKDFQKRFKVQFDTFLIDKILIGKKTELDPSGKGQAHGVTDGNAIALRYDSVVNTSWHELVHLILNNLSTIPEFSKFSREDILKAQAEKMGVEYDARKEEKDKAIEEQLAVDMESYSNLSYKPKNSLLGRFFKYINDTVKNFRNLITKSNGDVITNFYDAIRYGETKRKNDIELEQNTKITKYLADNILDYTPYHSQTRVLSISNGITSIDFRSVEEYGMSHRPTKGVPAFDLIALVDGEQMIPSDMYTQWYGSRGTKADLESIAVLKKVKGNPEADVTIYRASPRNEFNNGDWVTLSKTYATEHAEGNSSKVHSKVVKAKDIRWAMDDVNEFGYYPENNVSFKTRMSAVKKVTGLDQIRINYFASHMDMEDVKVLEDYMRVYDENLQIPPKKDEAISKEETKAIEYFTEGLKLEDKTPEQMASISTAILEQYYATSPKVTIWNEQPKFKEMVDKTAEVYKESGDLTTKILKDLEGKKTVSKQYIIDSLKRDGVKQSEKDVINAVLPQFEGATISVAEFAEKVKAELLPLERKKVGEGKNLSKYESIALPDKLRGNVSNYSENIYASPIKTSAGNVHFGGSKAGENYFGHTRIEDMADKTRRVIEVQSDLYQKGGVEKESNSVYTGNFSANITPAENIEYNKLRALEDEYRYNNPDKIKLAEVEKKMRAIQIKGEGARKQKQLERQSELSKLSQYNDPTAHFRMIREEIRRASLDGKTTLQFPTGETAMKIEGLGSTNQWGDVELSSKLVDENPSIGISRLQREARLIPENLKVGKEVNDGTGKWIITDVLEDGKFKAVDKFYVDTQPKNWEFEVDKSVEGKTSWMAINKVTNRREFTEFIPSKKQEALDFLKRRVGADNPDISLQEIGSRHGEQFDISGKVDTNNPIYKFYEKEVAKYLRNNYQAETITDDKGITWYEVKLKDEHKGAVIAFKEYVPRKDNEEYIKKMYPRYYAHIQLVKLNPVKVSRAYDRAKSRLGEEYQKDVSYTPIKIADEMAKAFELVKQNPELAKQIALGLELPPLDITETAIALAVSETAKEQKDYKTQAETESSRSLRQTRRGQEIVMENGRVDENSPSFFIKQVLERRKALIAARYTPLFAKKLTFNEVMDDVIKKKTQKRKVKTDLEIKVEDLNEFLNELAC